MSFNVSSTRTGILKLIAKSIHILYGRRVYWSVFDFIADSDCQVSLCEASSSPPTEIRGQNFHYFFPGKQQAGAVGTTISPA